MPQQGRNKTNCLTISRVEHSFCPLMMSSMLVEEVKSHCHRIRLQCDSKWGEQIDHMVDRDETCLRILKVYSTKLKRAPLRQLYLSYIRPVLEYSCQVWSNITIAQETRLEGAQLATIRCITGAKVTTNRDTLYREVCLPTLSE